MQPLLRDIFSTVIKKVRQNHMWEKFTSEELEGLVTEYLRLHYTGEKQAENPSKLLDEFVIRRAYHADVQAVKQVTRSALTKTG